MKTKAYLLITFLFAFVFAKAQIDQSVVTCAKGTALGTNSYSIAITDSKCFIPPLEKDGIEIGMMPAISNTGASTLKLNGWTARSIKKNGSALVSGDLVANVYYIAKYNSTTSCWDIIGGSSSGTEPAITPGTTAQYWRGDKTWQDFNSAARNAISLTTTGASGAATYNSGTGVLNVPNYSGTVTNFTATDANGIVWNINTPTTTPNITATLTNITPSTVNGNTINNGTGTLKLNTYQLEAIADNKVLNSTNATHLDGGSAGSIPYQSNPGATTYLAPGTNGQVITWLSGVPTNTTLTTGSVSSVNISGGTTGLTFSGGPITTAGTFTTSGTLAIANGGTGQTTANAAFNALSPNTTRGDITVRNATVNARLALGSAGTILRSDGTDLAYSTATYPNTTTANQILYSSATNTLGGSANLTYDGTTFSTPVAYNSTSLTSPLIIGGSGTTQSLTYKTTTGVGTTGADHIFKSGNNGATEIARMTNAGEFLIGKTAPTVGELVAFKKNTTGQTICVLENGFSAGVINYRIQGDSKDASFGLRNSGTGADGAMAPNDAYIYANTTNLTFVANGASAVIKWATGSKNEKMRLDASGRLGIGTTSPASQLDVEGGAAIGATYSGTTAAPTNGAIIEGLVGMGVSSPSAKLHLAAATSSVTPSMIINPASGTLRSITSGSINFHEGGELLEAAGADGWSVALAAWGTPTISGGIGTPTYAVTSGSTDVNVKVEYTSSMSPADDAVLFVITYEHALHRAGTVSVCPRNRAAALTPIYIEETTTGFTVKLATSTADTPVWDQTRYWGFQVKN